MEVPAAAVEDWPGIVAAPTHEILDAQAYTYRKRPLHSRDWTQLWICPGCKTEHEPRKNRIINLPVYRCSCGTLNPVSYHWKLTAIINNKVDFNYMVYDQKMTPYCSAYAIIGALDCSRRIQGSWTGIICCMPLDVMDLVMQYNASTKQNLKNTPFHTVHRWFDAVPVILRVVQNHGVSYLAGKTKFDEGPIPRLWIRSYFQVDISDVDLITRLLASGNPLIANVYVGRLFVFLHEGEPYYPPGGTRDSLGIHSVTLIGSGAERMASEVMALYICRDSGGIMRHPSYHLGKYGADFLVWAADVLSVWGFYLA